MLRDSLTNKWEFGCVFLLLITAEPPVIITAPANVFIDETKTATFTCVARADPAPVIYWIHNSTNVSSSLFVNSVHSSSSISARKSFARTSTLTIPGATNQANQGNYTCIAANIYKPDARTTASLSVYGKVMSFCASFFILEDRIWARIDSQEFIILLTFCHQSFDGSWCDESSIPELQLALWLCCLYRYLFPVMLLHSSTPITVFTRI